MVNLTSFELLYSHGVTVRQLLDFFESAPRLRRVSLYDVTPAPGAQSGRLVSMACLEVMQITESGSPSLLLDHLLIPVGARLTIEVDLPNHPINNHALTFLSNLKNFPSFIAVDLSTASYWKPHVQFSGPNGQVKMILSASRVNKARAMLESLDHFDTSRVELLTINGGNSSSRDPLYRALLPMKHLRTLTLRRIASPHIFVHALHPNVSPSGVVACPKLEELVIVLNGMTIDMKIVTGVVAARASRGAKLKSIRIVDKDKSAGTDVSELQKHVLHVEYGPEFDGDGDDAE
jgi:hypothetical protein